MTSVTFVYPEHESLGIAYLAAVCREAGFDSQVLLYPSRDRYTGFSPGTLDANAIADRVLATRPSVAAFSAVTDDYQAQLAVARAVKAKAPGVFVLFGGVHPTAVPERVLRSGPVDAVAIGEAERSLVQFLRAATWDGAFRPPPAPVPGLLWRGADGLVGRVEEGPLPDLDDLPFPDKRAFYAWDPSWAREYFIATSRGCPYRCTYCFNSCLDGLRVGPRFRRRSIGNVLAELEWAMREFPVETIHFADDSFTADPRWLREFSASYRKEIGLPFLCSANPDLVDPAAVRALADAGCVEVQLGVQSLSERLSHDLLDRKCDRPVIARAITLLGQAGILVQADMMLGLPGDTLEEQEDSLRFLNQSRPGIVSVFWLTYYPGTEILKRAETDGLLTPSEVERIEDGFPIGEGGLHTGGSARDPGPFRAVHVLYEWLPLLPRWFVDLLVRTRGYRVLRIRSYLLSTALPRVIRSLLDRRYFTGRNHLRRFIRATGRRAAP